MSYFSKRLVLICFIFLVVSGPDSVSAQASRVGETAQCSVEIRILTPGSLVFWTGSELRTTYRMDSVAAGWIQLAESKYNEPQRYRLSPGRLNRFDLILEVTHDYHAFDSLHLSFRPILEESGSVAEDGSTEDDVIRVGRFPVDLLRANYIEDALSSIVLGSGESIRTVAILEARPRWQKLHKDLAANPGRRRLTKIIKYSSIAGVVISTLWAWQSHNQADDKYEDYLQMVRPVDISQSYRRYEDLIEKRNILGAFAITLAATGIVSFLTTPGSEYDLVDEYERRYGPSGISLDVGDDFTGVKLSWRF